MKNYILTSALLLAGLTAGAQITAPIDTTMRQIVDGVSVGNLKLEKSSNFFVVDMDVDLSELDVNSNRAVLLTPCLVNEKDTLALPAIGIYGRTRYYHYVRNGESMLTDEHEISYRSSQKPDKMDYHYTVDYEKWMRGSKLVLKRDDYGCCNSLLAQQKGMLGRFVPVRDESIFYPELVFVPVEGNTVKEFSKEDAAYVEFVVNKTDIRPDYRNNVAELGKILSTIDSLKVDGDVTIKSVWLKGYASPESPYNHNKALAQGRVAALKDYIKKLYNFPDSVISTEYEPENWEGLKAFVEASNLEHRDQILDIINSDRGLDTKEWLIKSQYPADYRFLLGNCYPALRRTEYKIAYNVRTYTNVEEIKRVMAEAPQKLSLNEFYVLAQEYKPGSPEFTNVFETAVRMYPNDAIANLNAANAAMRRKDLESVPRYLKRAGDSPEAVYARAAYAFLTEKYATARELFQKALELGVKEAAKTLQDIDKEIEYNEFMKE